MADHTSVDERIERLKRIRRTFCMHLGEQTYERVRADAELSAGCERILEGIAAVDAELARIEEARAAEARERDALAEAYAFALAAEGAGEEVPVQTLALVPEPEVSLASEDGAVQEAPVSAGEEPLEVVAPESDEDLLAPEPDPVAEALPADADASADEEGLVCPACGTPITRSFKFCMGCGRRLI